MPDTHVLVTGANGCIGAWVTRHLSAEGTAFTATDLAPEPTRPRLLMPEEEVAALDWRALDVTDTAAVRRLVAETGATHIVHLAGLQVPFCKADPALGAAVNVTGTVNILEAARHEGVRGLAYASSLAVLGPPELYPVLPVPDNAPTAPSNLYGTYKVANEEAARIFAADWGVGSAGLRPAIVYGVGRDQGMSSDIAKAILAVAANRPFHVRFSGPLSLQHASDMAEMFLRAARAEPEGAIVCNVRNSVTEVARVLGILEEIAGPHQVTCEEDAPLGVPSDLSDAALKQLIGDIPHMPLEEAIAQDLAAYRDLMEREAIDLTQLDR
ncbi:NAD-dependent epimerase/dehydratase family protein [Ovoidimarina sediminis]|uniref:NAD-dependent epimerase/dehydratase family protein n=1 Tax=Ovoidimarina sediminis TaxID=3079856 RepID=UPI0029062B37|nr:SDR family oxidoreductase [Rhodophyticola sp. MJ-SS7]MDU8944385.1 SDR family oxidoreductase [Rhodophyticola sp. MJ-SS7]